MLGIVTGNFPARPGPVRTPIERTVRRTRGCAHPQGSAGFVPRQNFAGSQAATTDKALRAGDYLGHMLDATAQIHPVRPGWMRQPSAPRALFKDKDYIRALEHGLPLTEVVVVGNVWLRSAGATSREHLGQHSQAQRSGGAKSGSGYSSGFRQSGQPIRFPPSPSVAALAWEPSWQASGRVPPGLVPTRQHDQHILIQAHPFPLGASGQFGMEPAGQAHQEAAKEGGLKP